MKRRLIDLLVLIGVDVFLYLVWSRLDVIVLFNLGFVWNWVANQNLEVLFENQRYRYSTVKMVVNIQNMVLKPFRKFPNYLQIFIKILPAGIFWSMVVYFNSSSMPWWATFLGSLSFELLRIEETFFTKLPPLPPNETSQ